MRWRKTVVDLDASEEDWSYTAHQIADALAAKANPWPRFVRLWQDWGDARPMARWIFRRVVARRAAAVAYMVQVLQAAMEKAEASDDRP